MVRQSEPTGLASAPTMETSVSDAASGAQSPLLLRGGEWLRLNWFYGWLFAAFLVSVVLTQFTSWDEQLATRAGIEAALTLASPLLYYLCYRGTWPSVQMAVRVLAVFCVGAYATSRLLPVEALSAWSPTRLRHYALAVVAIVEGVILVRVLRVVFSPNARVEDVTARSGAP